MADRREFTAKTRKSALKRSGMVCEALIKMHISYDRETGIFTCIKPYGRNGLGRRVGYERPDGYRTIGIAYQVFQEHHLAWWLVTGEWPVDQIDHINGLRADNRFENLREATALENNRNKIRMRNNSSGVNGVCFHRRDGNWRAYIMTLDGNRHLGYFPTFDEAVLARRAAEIEYGYHVNHGRIAHG